MSTRSARRFAPGLATLAVLFACVAFAPEAEAQGARGGRGDSLRRSMAGDAAHPRARGRAGGRQGRLPGQPGDRQALERRVRQAFARAVRRQLRLDDGQMQRLQATDAKYEGQRRALLGEERQARLALRTAMMDSTARDQAAIGQHLDRLLEAQRRRADLLAAEQRELSNFLTPMQRAQYLSLRERMARRLRDAARTAPGGPPPAPRDASAPPER